jgi:tagatose 1,6-diphosphate aldolase GatY/KbaY
VNKKATVPGLFTISDDEEFMASGFVPMQELLSAAAAGGYAVPSFCAWTAESMYTILGVATELRAPVILMNGPGEYPLMGPQQMADVAHTVIRRFSVPAALHLDHGNSVAQVCECLEAGYTSVMLDFSQRPYAENAAALREVVQRAHPRGVTVEGELGHVGRADKITTEGSAISTLTEVAEAAAYVAETGLDALAVSIGNAHGQYTTLPQLDFPRLAAIHEAVSIPLVLHGGSGTPEADLRRAISLGIAKVNVATELMTAMRHSLAAEWQGTSRLWFPVAQAAATRAMVPVIEKWFRWTGAAGRA